jgi:hypothetical protein
VREQQRQANEVAVAEFDAEATRLETDLLYNKDSGALTRRGKDALAIYEPTEEAYRKGVDKLVGGLSDPRQRQAAGLLAQKRWTAIDRSLQTHMAEQSRVHILEVGKTKVESAMQLAVAGKRGAPDPDTGETPITRSVRETQYAIKILGSNSGLDSATIKLMQDKSVSDIHASVIASYLSENDPKTAEAYLKANSAAMDAKDAERIKPIVRARALELDVSRIANKSLVKTADNGMVDLEESVRVAQAEAVKAGMDPLEVDAAVNATMSRARISDAQTRSRQESDERLFINMAIDQEKRGVPFDQAKNELFNTRKMGIGIDEATRLRRTQQLASLYAKDESFYNDAITKMDTKQKLAWDQIVNMAEAKFPKSETVQLPGDDFVTSTKDVFLNEMKRSVIGIPAEQMLPAAKKALEDVPDPHTYFSDRPTFIENYEGRMAREAGVAKLQSDPAYGASRVDRAREFLKIKLRHEPTPSQLKRYMDAETSLAPK